MTCKLLLEPPRGSHTTVPTRGPENTRKWSGKKRDGRIPPPMAKIALKGKASSMSWEHTQISRREGRRSDSTLNGMNNLEGGCSVEPVSWEINGKEDGCDPWRDLIITGRPENTRKWSGKKRDGRIPPPMAKIALKGEASSMSWEHTQISRKEGRRSDSTLNGMNNLEGGCSVEPVSWEINGKENGRVQEEQERPWKRKLRPIKARPLKIIYCDVKYVYMEALNESLSRFRKALAGSGSDCPWPSAGLTKVRKAVCYLILGKDGRPDSLEMESGV
ncbi:hypothetical protein DY000_02033842 [Brassica cretica]|uniref:Uncharacterized protein n=1 Tax=Brassica cretica TaxID=69181 RepID=A0ABQ7DQL9_BRACR|nr:hypothetical protein DY000_02033842 [Brassica cretica]